MATSTTSTSGEGPASALLRRGAFEFRHLLLRKDAAFPFHLHDRPHIVLLYAGRWQDTSASARYDVKPGEILFHPARFRHASDAEHDTEAVILNIDEEMTLTFCPLYGNVARDVHLSFEALRGVPDRIREELTHGDEAAPVILESLAMQMMALGSRTPNAESRVPPPWLAEVLSHIRRGLATELTVRSIAAAVGISPSRLSHVFRASMGRSVTAYMRESRVRCAAAALRETDAPISDVALQCGFYDQAHLTRAFKAVRGMTPLHYRRTHRRFV